MIEINLGIHPKEYARLQNFGGLNHEVRDIITQSVESKEMQRIILFGPNKTGEVVKEVLGSRFCGFADSGNLDDLIGAEFDAVFIATSPVHYGVITHKLSEILKNKPVMVVTLFDCSHDINIGLILETQPRSGTHYAINNVMRCLDWGYGSVFKNASAPELIDSKDGYFAFYPDNNTKRYVIKSHFYKPLHYPEYRYVKTMFQISFIMDSYYSWGKMLANRSVVGDYRLTSLSKEWQILKGYIPHNKQWLQYIRDKFYVRYEDYYLDFNTTINRMARFLGIFSLNGFEMPRKNKKRMYWSDNYHLYLEDDVFLLLLQEFYPYIRQYWPEKMESLVTNKDFSI